MNKNGKEAVNLSINKDVKGTLEAHLVTNRRKGVNLSTLTERLWMTYLRRKGVKLPPTCKALLKA